MSITLLVGSQNQLAAGIPWLERFAATMSLRPDICVLGKEHKTLELRAKKSLQTLPNGGQVHAVEADVDAVLDWVSHSSCRLLVMIDDVDDDRLEAEVFNRCGVRSVWINAKSPPPDSPQHVFAIDDRSRQIASGISQSLIGVAAGLELDHQWIINEPKVGKPDAAQTDLGKSTDPNSPVDSRSVESPNYPEKALELERQRCEAGDLIWMTFGPRPASTPRYAIGRSLLLGSSQASVALVSFEESWQRSLMSKVRYLASHVAAPMNREARLELANSLAEGSKPNLEFLGLISAAAMLAAFGLLQDSAAVIIGAMLIAPLMTPIMGAGLSLAQGNRPLFQTSMLAIAIGFAGAFGSSFLFGLLVRLIHEPVVTSEMWGRCNPSPLDFCVGLVGGMAACYARTRAHLSAALAGAAIAAALVPPISTAGLQAAFGVWRSCDEGWPVFGPLILVGVNVLTIMIGTSFVLYARGLSIEGGSKWATRMTVSLVTLVMVVLVWMMHLETWLFS